jgi:hypothetical protein
MKRGTFEFLVSVSVSNRRSSSLLHQTAAAAAAASICISPTWRAAHTRMQTPYAAPIIV